MIHNIDQYFADDFSKKVEYYQNDHPDRWSTNYFSNFEIYQGDVEYKFNSNGYRCDEFTCDTELPIVFLGCSNTLGLGINKEQVWAYKILEKIQQQTNKNIAYWNLAKNGSSIELQYLCLENHIKTLRPKYIFFQVPNIYRRCVYYQKNMQFILPTEQLHSHNQLAVLWNLFVDMDYAVYEAKKIFTLINALGKDYDAKIFFNFHWSNLIKEEEQELTQYIVNDLNQFKTSFAYCNMKIDYARDRAHDGPKFHEIFANNIWPNLGQHFND